MSLEEEHGASAVTGCATHIVWLIHQLLPVVYNIGIGCGWRIRRVGVRGGDCLIALACVCCYCCSVIDKRGKIGEYAQAAQE